MKVIVDKHCRVCGFVKNGTSFRQIHRDMLSYRFSSLNFQKISDLMTFFPWLLRKYAYFYINKMSFDYESYIIRDPLITIEKRVKIWIYMGSLFIQIDYYSQIFTVSLTKLTRWPFEKVTRPGLAYDVRTQMYSGCLLKLINYCSQIWTGLWK